MMPPAAYNTPLADLAAVILDFETTGLAVEQGARVVEIGALKLAAGAALDHYVTLVDPGIAIPPEASAIHGLRDRDVAGQPPYDVAFPPLFAFLEGAAVCAYNLKFDLSFLAAAARELEHPTLPAITIDILGLARRYLPGLPRYDLGTVAGACGFPNPQSHRAAGDVAAEAELFLLLAGKAAAAEGASVAGDLVLLSRGLPPAAGDPAVVVALEYAMLARAGLEVEYGGAREARRRALTPQRIVCKAGIGYVTAYCHESRTRKEFRLDRITLVVEV